MSFTEWRYAVHLMYPGASVGTDHSGRLVIYTGLMKKTAPDNDNDNEIVVPYEGQP